MTGSGTASSSPRPWPRWVVPRHPLARGGRFPGRQDPADGRILYTSDDRHAWPEMYFSGVGWVRFEPTPGQRSGATPSWTRQSARPGTDPAPPERCRQPAVGAEARGGGQTTPSRRRPVAAGPGVAVAACSSLVGAGSGAGARAAPSSAGAASRPRSGPPRRRCLGGAAGDGTRPGAGVARAPLAARTGPQRGRPGAPRTGDLKSLEGLLVRVEQGRYGRSAGETAGGHGRPEVRSRTVETVDSWRRAMVGSVTASATGAAGMWPVSVVRRRRS